MALTGWKDRLIVGHSKIDADHRKLVDILDQLEDAVVNHMGLETYGKVLNELIASTWAHFAYEEQLMAMHHYPQTEQHKREHTSLLHEIDVFKTRFDSHAITLSSAQLKVLEEWLTLHFMVADKALAAGIPAN
ncbi:MAG: bacteriohemerythrin [Sterolibacterium sp.]